MFFPTVGFINVKCGRYKTVICSLSFTAVSSLITTAISAIIVYYCSNLNNTNILALLFGVIFGTDVTVAWIAIISGYITFNANFIHFGVDQLYDSPSENSVLFIH